MMPTGCWTYSQASGALRGPAAAIVGVGYSGTGAGLNNPAMQDVRDVGPLPCGWWTIGPAYEHPHLGTLTMDLTPDAGTNTYGRDDFRIHGDNAARNFSASKGCMVQDHGPRSQVAGSPVRRLYVTP